MFAARTLELAVLLCLPLCVSVVAVRVLTCANMCGSCFGACLCVGVCAVFCNLSSDPAQRKLMCDARVNHRWTRTASSLTPASRPLAVALPLQAAQWCVLFVCQVLCCSSKSAIKSVSMRVCHERVCVALPSPAAQWYRVVCSFPSMYCMCAKKLTLRR